MPDANERPILRGHSHQAAFFFALGACSVLLLNIHSKEAILAMAIYSVSLIGLFGISALYHRITWKNPRHRLLMKRIDHAAIFILIAGTSTPLSMLALSPVYGIKLLTLVWSAAFVGIMQSLFWITAPRWLKTSFYVIVGCLIIPFFPQLKSALSMSEVWLLVVGGIVYITGAIIYALKRPNPIPQVFGYHEVFHLLVIAGASFHFLVNYKLVK